MNDDLRVPVLRVPVILHMCDGRSQSAFVFLAPGEAMDAFLDRREPFMPAEIGDKIVFFARAALASVSTDVRVLSSELHGVRWRKRAEVRLRCGGRIVGELDHTGDGSRRRTLDVLNEAGPRLIVQADGLTHHIAKHHVESIEELPGLAGSVRPPSHFPRGS
jgi:hypothetical protein